MPLVSDQYDLGGDDGLTKLRWTPLGDIGNEFPGESLACSVLSGTYTGAGLKPGVG
jgi:hypothetical protein